MPKWSKLISTDSFVSYSLSKKTYNEASYNWKYAKNYGISMGIINVTVMCVALLLTVNLSFAGSSDLYFPPVKGAWEKVSPGQAGWDVAKLKRAMEYAGKQNSSGVVILYRGRILTEKYWKVESAKRPFY